MEKKVISTLPKIYTAKFFYLGNKPYIGIGSEERYPSYIIDLTDFKETIISEGPGGTMSIIPAPEAVNTLYSVMGLFPPFVGMDAGVYSHHLMVDQWHTKKIFNLPFAHRCEILRNGGINYLFVASVSRFKNDPHDWSLPGEVYILPMEDIQENMTLPNPIIKDLTRNHGMAKVCLDEREAVCVSGLEGIFAIFFENNTSWRVSKVFDKEVSEFAFLDLDNDGEDELVTIEPFHGNSLNIYDKKAGEWHLCYQSILSFGHGLSAGFFNGIPSIVVGNRQGKQSLDLFMIHNLATRDISLSVIEESVGPTQTSIINFGSRDYILSSNQVKGEVALYFK